MAELIRKTEPEYIIKISLEEAMFISWIYDEMNNFNYDRYTEHAQNMAGYLSAGLEEHVPIYDSTTDYLKEVV